MADEPKDNPLPKVPASPDVQPYELAPAEPAPAPPPGAPASPAPHAPGKLSDKGLIDDMPEDADFTHDPEVEAALKGESGEKDKSKDTVDEDAKPAPPFVKPGVGNAKTTALVGAGITIAAVIASAVGSPEHGHWFLTAVLALYFIVIHTISGVGALMGGAKISDQPLGAVDLAGARMLVAVSLFVLLVNLNVGFAHHYIEPVFAAAGYWLSLSILLRLPWSKLFYVAMIHLGLACVVWIGMVTYAGATAAPVK